MTIPAVVPIDQRFTQLIKQFGLTKNSFAISLGKTASVIQHLIDGRNKPGFDLLCRVFEIYPNVSRDWLLLGRGPMLVSGEPALKAAASVPATAAEVPLEPIDFPDVEAPAQRRAATGLGGSRLQPTEITATLALAAAANQPARAAAPVPVAAPAIMAAPPAPAMPGPAPEPVIFAVPPAAAQPTPLPEATPAAPAPPVTGTAVAPAVAVGISPELYVTAALHAQHLQHQLALAEMRNQFLLEQQQMMREMLAMARQAMV